MTLRTYYSICPVYVVSHVAHDLGWLEEELGRAGAALAGLGTLPEGQAPLVHARHSETYQMRDGGNIPAIWARAEHADTVLVGSTWVEAGGQIVVRTGDDIRRVQDLSGRRFGLSKSRDTRRVDWWRANSQRNAGLALALAGLSLKDVEVIDIEHGSPQPRPGAWHGWDERSKEDITFNLPFTPEIHALADGRVDAIYTTQGRAQIYERSGRFRVIEDLARYPDWTLQIAASPYTLAVSRPLATERRDVVVAWLRANIRAARWIESNPADAARLLHRHTYHATVADVARAIAPIDFLPSLSARNLHAIDIGKAFLRDHGYLQNDFDVAAWADTSFLEEALASLPVPQP